LDDDEIVESNEETVVATFSEAGTYNVTLTITDSEDQIASDSIEITVEEGEGGEEEAAVVEDKEGGVEIMNLYRSMSDPLTTA
jgi:PKD repeat protein